MFSPGLIRREDSAGAPKKVEAMGVCRNYEFWAITYTELLKSAEIWSWKRRRCGEIRVVTHPTFKRNPTRWIMAQHNTSNNASSKLIFVYSLITIRLSREMTSFTFTGCQRTTVIWLWKSCLLYRLTIRDSELNFTLSLHGVQDRN
jgi:hypothetical protein